MIEEWQLTRQDTGQELLHSNGHSQESTSFVTKSKGTWGGADKDLAAKVRG